MLPTLGHKFELQLLEEAGQFKQGVVKELLK